MTILAIYTVEGDPADLQTRYDRALPRIVEVSPASPQVHLCTTFESGLRIFDVWESAEQLEDFAANPGFRQALADAGLPEPKVEVVPVHRFNW